MNILPVNDIRRTIADRFQKIYNPQQLQNQLNSRRSGVHRPFPRTRCAISARAAPKSVVSAQGAVRQLMISRPTPMTIPRRRPSVIRHDGRCVVMPGAGHGMLARRISRQVIFPLIYRELSCITKDQIRVTPVPYLLSGCLFARLPDGSGVNREVHAPF